LVKIEGFIALVPVVPSVELEALAAACVREFDPFRAPLSEDDRVRRDPAKLTPRQREHLDRWGYPHVFETFRFHMTLTGRLDAGRRAPIVEILRSRFRDTGVNDLVVDRIALFRQDDPDQRFRVLGNWSLQDADLSGQAAEQTRAPSTGS